ncbi:MAG: Acylphosphate phosphohydrolase, putative [uncultured Rubrobacteraceae bacterium]|uniref:Acylphosphatase n=1 Tax=uncultured Rubrobacteraceae bacterium TaxID=349277 RepID=A0A6J4RAB2_9ACTN|nr:MAG: Acylphosphate phosphohydrolase, putative [uncultured Rubrobacteraceae bacterium]
MQRDDRKRAHVRISGQVQGVFFRDSTREKAQELGLSGYVKNTPDGDVEALFEGPPEGVEEMVRWCGQGPPHASVENVEAKDEPPSDDLTGFEVR